MIKKTNELIKKRQQQLNEAADKYLHSLINEFVHFKNKHLIEKRGILKLDVEAEAYKKMIIEKWFIYCQAMNRNSNRLLNYEYTACMEAIENHISSHKKLCWINYCMKLLAKIGIKSPDMDVLEAIYKDKRSCRMGSCIYLSNGIKIKYKKLLQFARNNQAIQTPLIPEVGIS